jgi:hypothetical protein
MIKNIFIFTAFFLLMSQKSYAEYYNLKKETKLVEFQHEKDTRKVKSESSPKSLNAVGKLGFKKYLSRNKFKNKGMKLNCTANLIAPEGNIGSNLILTARHCLSDEITIYTWTSMDNNGNEVVRNAKLAHKEKSSDWAILKLSKSISHSKIKPLIAKNINFKEDNFKKSESESFTVAGFSMDWLGNYGKKLTYEENPVFVCTADGERHSGQIGAVTYQGDSGGAVIYEDENKSSYLVGIMSHIVKNKELFKSSKGSFGNITGHFVSFIGYETFFSILNKHFYR